jgi:uncharacterized protein (DUF433 family)
MGRLAGLGIYDAREIAFLLGTKYEAIVRWAMPDQRGLPPLVQPYTDSYFTFEDLVSFAVVLNLHQRGVVEKDLRNGVDSLRQQTGMPRPLANREVLDKIATSGSSFLLQFDDEWVDLGRGGQGTFKAVIRVYLKGISFNQVGIANKWNAAESVLIDPSIQAGSPCIVGTRIPTSTILELLEDESPFAIAEEFDLTTQQVEAARDFELNLSSGHGLLAA